MFKAIVLAAVLVSALVEPTPSREEALNVQTIGSQYGISVEDREKSSSISFLRSSGGITQIGIERLDTFPSGYVTMVTASGPTRDAVAIAAATLQTFANLDPQSLLADSDSITFAFNQAKPSYVISELERAKLISSAEAFAAKTAFGDLQSRMIRNQR
jgi:hypothetical protein